MKSDMKRPFVLSILLLLVACSSPTPAPEPVTPSPVPSASPSLTPSISPTATPIFDNIQLPALEKTFDLGANSVDQFYLMHPIALDEKSNRLYVSAAFTKTLVLEADTLTAIGEVPFGGSMSILPDDDRLYIGVPGSYGYDGSQGHPAELKMFDASTLAFRRSAVFSDTSVAAPYAVPDPVTGKLYIVHAGVYVADADSLEISGTLSGTVPTPGDLVPNYAAVDAAIDPARQHLFVSVNNGIPGSNNGSVMYVYNLAAGRLIAQDGERSVLNIALDPQAGEAYVPRSHMASAAIVKYDAQGQMLRRLDNIMGYAQVDALHRRVYLLDDWHQSRLVVLDTDLNYLAEVRFDSEGYSPTFYFDAKRDRLYVLSTAGQLIVLHGHAGSATPALLAPKRGAVQWIVPSPIENDRLVYAAFGTESYSVGSGALFRSHDDGTTWEFAAGLPATDTVASLVFSPDYANDQTLFAAFAPYGGNNGGSGVYRSTDGGRTWRPSSHGLTDLSIKQLIISPDYAHDGTAFAWGASRGLFRSTDSGVTWASIADRYMHGAEPYEQPTLSALAVSPNFAADNSLIISRLSGTGGILVSHDRGASWSQVLADTAVQLAYASHPTTNTLFAVLSSGAILRSEDGGDHWVASSAGLDLQLGHSVSAFVTTLHPEPSYAAWLLSTAYHRPSQLYSTLNGDQPWTLNDENPTYTTIAVKQRDTPDFAAALYIGTSDGRVIRMPLSDVGVHVQGVKPIAGQVIQSIAIGRAAQRNEVFVGGGAGLWSSTDLVNWHDTGFPDRNIGAPTQIVPSPDYEHDTTLYATAGHGLYRSRDGGHQWPTLEIRSSTSMPIGSVAISPNYASDRTLLIAGDLRLPSIMATADAGDTWATINPPFPITQSVAMRVAITPDNVWWVWIDYYGLYRSGDHGRTWTQPIARNDTIVQSMAFSPDYLNDGTLWIGLLYGTILKTNDAGRTWRTFNGDFLAGKVWTKSIVFSPDYTRDRTVWVATDNGLFRSADRGETWKRVDTGLPFTEDGLTTIGALDISPAYAEDHTLLAAMIMGGLSISRDGGNSWTNVVP